MMGLPGALYARPRRGLDRDRPHRRRGRELDRRRPAPAPAHADRRQLDHAPQLLREPSAGPHAPAPHRRGSRDPRVLRLLRLLRHGRGRSLLRVHLWRLLRGRHAPRGRRDHRLHPLRRVPRRELHRRRPGPDHDGLAHHAVPIVAMVVTGGPATQMFHSAFVENPEFGSLVAGASIVAIVGNVAWGLGYFGQPHIIVRFMALRSARDAKYGATVGIGWMVICVLGDPHRDRGPRVHAAEPGPVPHGHEERRVGVPGHGPRSSSTLHRRVPAGRGARRDHVHDLLAAHRHELRARRGPPRAPPARPPRPRRSCGGGVRACSPSPCSRCCSH